MPHHPNRAAAQGVAYPTGLAPVSVFRQVEIARFPMLPVYPPAGRLAT